MTDEFDFDLAPELAGQLDGSISGDAIRLPFDAPFIFWTNGNRQLRPAGGVPYFGGWATSSEDADAMLAGRELPLGFQRLTLANAAGKDYDAYCSRIVYAAKIGHREQWKETDSGKKQSHLQVLVYLSEYDQQSKKFLPWGPAVLTGKGFSGQAIKTALSDWERKTMAGRKTHANNLSANLFYAPLGTFGQEPQFRMVGSGSQSPITPCEAKISQEVTRDYLRAYYVGKAIAEEMASLKSQAESWLNAWKERAKAGNAPHDDGFYGAPPPPPEDEIPF